MRRRRTEICDQLPPIEIGSDRLQQLSDERANLIGIDPIEGTGFVPS
jgi:hypothetical protein